MQSWSSCASAHAASSLPVVHSAQLWSCMHHVAICCCVATGLFQCQPAPEGLYNMHCVVGVVLWAALCRKLTDSW